MLPFRLVYHPHYDLNLGSHVFPSAKYRRLRERLLKTGFATEEDFVEPAPVSDEDLLLVHDPAWIAKLKHGTLAYHEVLKLEIPYSRQTIEAFWTATGGTLLAARLALTSGLGFNLGGGFHHAFAAYGEGFCAVNDVAVAVRRLQSEGAIQQAIVVDVDVHHGNGTAGIFAGDPSVFTLSIHQANNYPAEKPPSRLDIDLADGTGDAEYLARLEEGLCAALAEFRPDLLVYVAGADPFVDDQLGGLALTFEGLLARDRLVFTRAGREKMPVAVVLAGGYAVNVEDTVTVHAKTAQAALSYFDARDGRQRGFRSD